MTLAACPRIAVLSFSVQSDHVASCKSAYTQFPHQCYHELTTFLLRTAFGWVGLAVFASFRSPISDSFLTALANSLGLLAVFLIVVFQFVEVNAKREAELQEGVTKVE